MVVVVYNICFKNDDDEIIKFLDKKLSVVSDHSILFNGLEEFVAPSTTVNIRMQVRPDSLCGILSEYIV